MRNRENRFTEEIELPELEIRDKWKKIIDKIIRIPRIFWIICFSVLLLIFLKIMPLYMWKYLWVSFKANGVFFSLVLVFGLVAFSLTWSFGQRIDVWVFRLFNISGKRAHWLDVIMLSLTQMGNFIFCVIIALIFFIKGNRLLAYELTLGILTLGLVVGIMKILIHRTRPFNKLKDIRIVGSRASGQSFPSGHTSQAFFMVAIILHYFNVNAILWLVLYGVALLVGITRIYVGMHYPRDVLGGAILGTAWGIIGIIVNSYIFNLLGIHLIGV